mmetsp:Transcript_12635/g.26849  ORF Transcript_12635/g.26849 Transcript_12635/m.26849 type:complete len:439 (+) Transcript_12635:271-1587(+)
MIISLVRAIARILLFTTISLVPSTGVSASFNKNNDYDPLLVNFTSHLAWFQSQGGAIDPRVTIGYDPNIPNSHVRGVISNDFIPVDTVLVRCPSSLILKRVGDQDCQLIEQIWNELKLGERSKWFPMFEFDDISGSRIPCQWNRVGRAIAYLQGLWPAWGPHRHLNWYIETCLNGERDESTLDDLEMKALLTSLTRSSDAGLVPMYLLFNHNNALINTRLTYTEEGGMTIIANENIQLNEPIYITYNRAGFATTSDVFNLYGFIEDYPQIWTWPALLGGSLDRDDRIKALTNDEEKKNIDHEYRLSEYEILVISPTLGALSPTRSLLQDIGNRRISYGEWIDRIHAHHSSLRLSHARKLSRSASLLLDSLPTTIKQDSSHINYENTRMQFMKAEGKEIRDEQLDALQAIEYRLAYKKALRLAIEVAESGGFLEEFDEL